MFQFNLNVSSGAIANSLFNDTLKIQVKDGRPVPLLRTGIAWPSDRNIKFRNPPGDLKKGLWFCYIISVIKFPNLLLDLKELESFAKPKAWSKNLWELDLLEPSNNGFQVYQVDC